MNPLRFIPVFFMVACTVFSSSCKRPPTDYYVFTTDELAWMPHDTAHTQGYFVNDVGDSFPLQLTYRAFSHPYVTSTEYGAHGKAEFMLDTMALKVELNKDRRAGMDFGAPGDFACDLTVDNILFPELNDETRSVVNLQIGSQSYTGVTTVEIDTVLYDHTVSRIYYKPGVGLLRVNMRNGHYYEKR